MRSQVVLGSNTEGFPKHDVQLVIPKPSWEFFRMKRVLSVAGCLAFCPGRLNKMQIAYLQILASKMSPPGRQAAMDNLK